MVMMLHNNTDMSINTTTEAQGTGGQCLSGCYGAEGLEDVLQAQLQSYAGLEEIESIASTCSRSMNSRGESETSHGHYVSRLSISNRSTPGDSAHSSPGGDSMTGTLCMLCCAMRALAQSQS